MDNMIIKCFMIVGKPAKLSFTKFCICSIL